MSRPNGYAWSTDGEIFHGSLDTREDAIKEGRECGSGIRFFTGRAVDFEPDFLQAAEVAVEQLYTQAEDDVGEASEDWDVNSQEVVKLIADAIKEIVMREATPDFCCVVDIIGHGIADEEKERDK